VAPPSEPRQAAAQDSRAAPAREVAPEPKPIPPPQAKPEPRRPTELERLIATSRERLQAGAWIDGSDSAKASLSAARELAPDSGPVNALWGELQDRVLDAGQRAAAGGDLAGARRRLQEARGLEVPAPKLAGLESAIASAERAQTEALRSDLLAKGLDRLQQDRLTAPADDSAAFYLTQLRGLDPNFAGVQNALLDLSRKLLRRANDAAERSDWPAASASLAQAEALSVNEELVSVTAERVRRGARQAELFAEVIPGAELTLVSARAPEYPRAAVRRNQEGWVELDFTVGRDGATRDIRVSAAEPEGVFDEAATEALGGYVFEPYKEAGEVYERRARVRMRFALD
jgi:TonB family protein